MNRTLVGRGAFADGLQHSSRRELWRALLSDGAEVRRFHPPDGFEVMDAQTGSTLAHFPQIGSFHHAAVRPGRNQFAAYADGKVWLLDWDAREATVELACPAGARRLAWSRDGQQVAVVGNRLEAEVGDMETRQLRRLSGHRDSLFDVAFDLAGEA